MSKKKILVIIPYFIPAYSYWWPVSVAYNYALKLKERGHDITVVTTDALDEYSRIENLKETINWIKIIRFKNISNYLAKFYNIYLPIWFTNWIKKNIKNYDIVHVHDFFTYLSIVVWVYCRKNKIPYVIQPHWCANFLPERWKLFLKKIFFKLFGMKLLDWAKSIITVSNYESDNIYYSNKDKVEVIHNWIDIDMIEKYKRSITEKDIIEFKRKFWIEWRKIIFSMWRLHRVKRFDKLIDWSKDILKNDDYCLVIVWPDEWEKEKLSQQIKNNRLEWKIILTWWLYWKEKYIAYQVADIFTLLSDSEAWAVTLTVAEAICFNLPLILSKWCNFEYESDYAKIVKNKTDFESSIYSLIDKKGEFSFWKEFDINHLVNKLEKIYNE